MTEQPKPKCKRCKDRGILVVDNGFHYINCPNCHPSYAALRDNDRRPEGRDTK